MNDIEYCCFFTRSFLIEIRSALYAWGPSYFFSLIWVLSTRLAPTIGSAKYHLPWSLTSDNLVLQSSILSEHIVKLLHYSTTLLQLLCCSDVNGLPSAWWQIKVISTLSLSRHHLQLVHFSYQRSQSKWNVMPLQCLRSRMAREKNASWTLKVQEVEALDKRQVIESFVFVYSSAKNVLC